MIIIAGNKKNPDVRFPYSHFYVNNCKIKNFLDVVNRVYFGYNKILNYGYKKESCKERRQERC